MKHSTAFAHVNNQFNANKILNFTFSLLFCLCSLVVFGQQPHNLLNSWNSNTEGGTTYPGCEQWKITYPTGDEEKDLCSTVSSNRREFYYTNSSGNGIVFRAPIRDDNGTTPNSDNVRCELREREIDGGKDVYWTTSGNHVIYVRQAITHLPIRKPHLVATQIHGNKSAGIDDAMVVRLENKKLFLSFNGGKLRSDVTIKTNYNLGTVHEVIFQVIDGKHYCYYSENGNLKSAFANGNASSYLVKDGTNSVLLNRNYGEAYFKAGNYTQSNPDQEGSDTGKSNNYGEVIIYDLYVDHNGNSNPGGGGSGGGDTCDASAVPSNRHIDNIGNTSATFDWNAVANNDHYNVRWRQKGTSSWSYKTSIRGSTSYTVSGLKSDTTYEWQMRSKCADGSGAAYNQGPGPDFKTTGGSSGGGGGGTGCALPWTDNDFSVTKQTTNYSSGTIDISCASSVCLSMTLAGIGNMESADFINVTYKVNGGSTKTLYQKTDSFSETSQEDCGISGNTLEIFIQAKTSASNETYYISDMLVEAEGDSGGGGGGSSGGGSKIVIITKRNAPGYAIDGKGGGVDGQNVHLWTTNANNENQQWIEIDRGNGFYSYQKNNTNYCLDGKGGGANGQNVHIWTCNSNNQNQHWKKQSTSGGAYKLIKRNAQGYAINGGSGGKKGQNVNLYNSSSSSYNLQWFITTLNNNYVQAPNTENTVQIDADKAQMDNSDFHPEGQNSNIENNTDIGAIRTELDDQLLIYPNPVNDVFTIELQDAVQSSQVGLEIIELATGKVIHKDSYSQSLIEMNSTALQSGTYLLRITFEDGRSYIKKMVKM